MNTFSCERHRITVAGQVQGVGFRPFVYRLATERTLSGEVSNTPEGVIIEIQGSTAVLKDFFHALQTTLPPLAQLSSCQCQNIPIRTDEKTFTIIKSRGNSKNKGHNVLISPDVGICQECIHDILDKNNRRFHYPFTNCTNCGPRYTITHSIPYDRATTSMNCFPLCAACSTEYEDPCNRRFHAQPNACPLCGPAVWCVDKEDIQTTQYTAKSIHGDAALQHIATALQQGHIAAIKGLGGFHLSCDATNITAIQNLRQRKHRPHKALAIMVADMATAHTLAHIGSTEEALLTSAEKPIVLCPRRTHSTQALLPNILAPDTDTIGLVLPYTPLHMVLFSHYKALLAPHMPAALVMTSGNAGGEPICLSNREALRRLASIADIFLLHNRDILVRTDDSVVCSPTSPEITEHTEKVLGVSHAPTQKTSPTSVFLRRARGYVPRPIVLGNARTAVLGMGAELKSTVCLSRGNTAFVSQHIGDLQNLETLAFYREVIQHLEMLLETRPTVLVHDKHPNFLSTEVAQSMAQERDIPCYALQHHFAHGWSVIAEHNFTGKTLVLALDGTGMGDDGTIWGGEVLSINTQSLVQERLGRLAPFPLPGGERAITEPWRIAFALASTQHLEHTIPVPDPTLTPMLLAMLQKGINCPQTSSAGRLFDAIAAALGLCSHTSYEGQAAIRLEKAQKHVPWTGKGGIKGAYVCAPVKNGTLWELPSANFLCTALEDICTNTDYALAARRFHVALAHSLVALCRCIADEQHIETVALSGGVLQNATIHALLPSLLQKQGLHVLMHKNIPANDGGISLGQVAWGQSISETF